MEYKASNRLSEEDENDDGGESEVVPPDILDIEDEELDTWPEELALDALTKKSKTLPARFSLAKRRRIEELQEERRLSREFDCELDAKTPEKNHSAKN